MARPGRVNPESSSFVTRQKKAKLLTENRYWRGLLAEKGDGGMTGGARLVVALVQSRHQYVHVTHSQKLEDLLGGLEAAFAFVDGVPRRLILDNLRAAITKRRAHL